VSQVTAVVKTTCGAAVGGIPSAVIRLDDLTQTVGWLIIGRTDQVGNDLLRQIARSLDSPNGDGVTHTGVRRQIVGDREVRRDLVVQGSLVHVRERHYGPRP